jgi:hypothetical protein
MAAEYSQNEAKVQEALHIYRGKKCENERVCIQKLAVELEVPYNRLYRRTKGIELEK